METCSDIRKISYWRPESDNKEYMRKQYRAYMGSFTDWTLEEAYEVYTRPGCGGKKWSKKEAAIFEKSKEIAWSENPYIFRFMPPSKVESPPPPK